MTTTTVDLEAFVEANGYYAGATLPDGRVAFLVPRLFGCDICICAEAAQEAGIDELFTYNPTAVGVIAWTRWLLADFAGDPEGWIRHRPSNRRRPDGDPDREFVAP